MATDERNEANRQRRMWLQVYKPALERAYPAEEDDRAGMFLDLLAQAEDRGVSLKDSH